MNDQDDDEWFEALAGRPAGDSGAAGEASALRRALLTHLERQGAPPLPDVEREKRLLERARGAGILAPRRPRLTRIALAAATLLGVGTAFWLVNSTQQPSFVVRSAADGVVKIEAADPHALKRRLLMELHAAGIDATGYQFLGREGIDADVPAQPTPAMTEVLDRYGIDAAAGSLRIEIAAEQ